MFWSMIVFFFNYSVYSGGYLLLVGVIRILVYGIKIFIVFKLNVFFLIYKRIIL